MISLENLKQKKALLEEKRTSLIAEEKFLNSERARLQKQIEELGYSSVEEAEEALGHLQNEIYSLEQQFNTIVDALENSSSSYVQPVQQSQEPKRSQPLQVPQSNPEASSPSKPEGAYAALSIDDL